ncbi:MAG: 50S ribosomal protein L18 [Candidatus Saccharibacteria bacterium]|nr:50S ribosomal protein L18 [Candidatus Saccharibacteria bacterium]
MTRLLKIKDNKQQRRTRIRRQIKNHTLRPRLCVHISLRHIYAQVIDDVEGKTLVASSTLKKNLKQSLSKQAEIIGKEIAEKCLKAKIKQVVLDRGCKTYHGRLKILAEASRQGGLEF